MKIDGNELAIEQNELDREGRHAEAMAIKREFLKQVRESGDHCPCKQACPHHGNCFECVTLHRGHRDHLPMCMWDMVNERLHKLSRLTEGTLRSYEEAHRILQVARILLIQIITVLILFVICGQCMDCQCQIIL